MYTEYYVRRKVIRKTKLPTKAQQEDIVMQAAELRQAAQMAAEEGRRLVYLDEFMLTKRTMLTHAWTLPRTNIKIDMKQLKERPIAVVVAASR